MKMRNCSHRIMSFQIRTRNSINVSRKVDKRIKDSDNQSRCLTAYAFYSERYRGGSLNGIFCLRNALRCPADGLVNVYHFPVKFDTK